MMPRRKRCRAFVGGIAFGMLSLRHPSPTGWMAIRFEPADSDGVVDLMPMNELHVPAPRAAG